MLNKVVVMGRLTRDPELRKTGNDTSVLSFSIAVDRDFTSGDSNERETDFIDIVAWRKTAEFVSKYFSKGSMIVVSGRLQVRNYEDKDGNNRKAVEVVADTVYFGESKRNSGDSDEESAPKKSASSKTKSKSKAKKSPPPDEEEDDGYEPIEDDDLPF